MKRDDLNSAISILIDYKINEVFEERKADYLSDIIDELQDIYINMYENNRDEATLTTLPWNED